MEYETAGSLTVTGNYHHQADARLLIDVGGIVPGSYSRTTSDGHDFLAWQRQFGSGVNSLASAQVVPEPTMVSLLVIALATMPRFPHAQTTKFRPVVTLPLI